MPIDPTKLPFKTRFTVSARAFRPTETQQFEVKASVEKLRGLLPTDIDPAAHPTILYVVGNLFVSNLVNLNDDAVSIADSLRIYRQFEGQQVNIEHSRGTIVGYIVKAGLSEFGTDRLISEDEARAANKPFNVAIAAAIWKVADPDLINYILEGAIPGSPVKDDLSLSFEVGFDDYSVATLSPGSTDLALATSIVTSASPAYTTLNKALRISKGDGSYRGERVARVLAGNIIPLGAGIVGTPAAAVKGITPVVGPEYEDGDQDESGAGLYKYSSTQVTLSKADAAPFIEFGASIPDDHIYTDPADPTLGRETEPHATVFYGIKGAEVEPIQQLTAQTGPIKMTLGTISAFEGGDRPYDVLKVDVESADLSRLHHLIKATVPNESKWPDYHPHLTLAYLRKGMASRYVGDTRFQGREFTFGSLTFSPHTGARVEIPLAQVDASLVYSSLDDHDPMAFSRYIKLSAGWQDKLAAAKAEFVDVTLSDGRKLLKARVLDATTLELSEEVSLAGVVISELVPVVQTMTPGVGPQMDDAGVICPVKDVAAPTVRPEKQAQNAADLAEKRAAQVAPLTGPDRTDASVQLDRFAELVRRAQVTQLIKSISPSVSSTTPPMKLEDLKQSLASVKTVEDLPTAVANVALFAEEIAKASEAHIQARKTAEEAAKAAQDSLKEVKATLDTITKAHNDLLAAQAVAAAEAAFNTRMATIQEVFAFDDDTKSELLPEVKACADEEAFAKWLTRAKKLFKHFTREHIAAEAKKAVAAAPAKEDDEEKEKKMKEDCASAAKTAIASAQNAVVDTPVINTVDASANKPLAERMKEAFANGISIGGKKLSELNSARAAKTSKA